MKNKDYYLKLDPPGFSKERWIQEVDFVFDDKKSEQEWVEYLERFYKSRPKTIQERWKDEEKTYK